MVDRDLVLRKIADLELYASQAAEYADLTVEAYRSDWKVQRIVGHTLQIAIEACANIAHHVISDRELRVPATYAETFEVLRDADLLDGELCRTMVAMTGFRNVVVHEYASVDASIVIRILNEHLADFVRFAEASKGWV